MQLQVQTHEAPGKARASSGEKCAALKLRASKVRRRERMGHIELPSCPSPVVSPGSSHPSPFQIGTLLDMTMADSAVQSKIYFDLVHRVDPGSTKLLGRWSSPEDQYPDHRPFQGWEDAPWTKGHEAWNPSAARCSKN